jgi:hypothetical protein
MLLSLKLEGQIDAPRVEQLNGAHVIYSPRAKVEKAIVATVVFYGFFLWSRQFLGAGLRTGYPSHLTGGLVHGQMSRTLPSLGK